MEQKREKILTEGIILNTIKYKETSLIVKVMTKELGLVTLMANGVRGQKSKLKIGFFQVFTIIETVIHYNSHKEIHRFAEIRCKNPLHNIYMDVKKRSILFFLNELLNKCILYQDKDVDIYLFLKNSITQLEEIKEGIGTFHLQFMLKFMLYLGFGINNIIEMLKEINDKRLKIVSFKNTHHLLTPLIHKDYGEKIEINKNDKIDLLKLLIQFYQVNIPNFTTLTSLDVLRKIFK